jgi:hypothetical protein
MVAIFSKKVNQPMARSQTMSLYVVRSNNLNLQNEQPSQNSTELSNQSLLVLQQRRYR